MATEKQADTLLLAWVLDPDVPFQWRQGYQEEKVIKLFINLHEEDLDLEVI